MDVIGHDIHLAVIIHVFGKFFDDAIHLHRTIGDIETHGVTIDVKHSLTVVIHPELVIGQV